MFKNARKNFKVIAAKAKQVAAKSAAVGSGLMMTGAAFAQSDLGAAETAVTTQQAAALGIVVLGTVAILVIRYSKLARRA